jgi:integrase/recombinase XerC
MNYNQLNQLKLSDLIEEYLRYLLYEKGYTKEITQIYEIPLRQLRDNCRWFENDGTLVLDITPFKYLISKNNKRTLAKKLSAIHSFIKYIEERVNKKVVLKGDEPIKISQKSVELVDVDHIKEIFEKSSLEDKLITALFYGLGLRVSEIASLKVDNVTPDKIKLESGKEFKTFPKLKKILTEVLSKKLPNQYLIEVNNEPLNKSQIRYRLQKLLKLKDVKSSSNQIRHSFHIYFSK